MLDKIVQIAATDDYLYGLSRSGRIFFYNEDYNKWILMPDCNLYERVDREKFINVTEIEDER